MRPAPAVVAAVFLGGALGTLARYGVGLFPVSPSATSGLALMTACNLLGSALLGAISAWPPTSPKWAPLRVGLGTGFCGGFTTLSYVAFTVAVLVTADAGAPEAWGLLALGILGGLAANWLGAEAGIRLGRRIIGSGVDWRAATAERIRMIWAQTRRGAESARGAASEAIGARRAARAAARGAAGSTSVDEWPLEDEAMLKDEGTPWEGLPEADGVAEARSRPGADSVPNPRPEGYLPTAAFDAREFPTESLPTTAVDEVAGARGTAAPDACNPPAFPTEALHDDAGPATETLPTATHADDDLPPVETRADDGFPPTSTGDSGDLAPTATRADVDFPPTATRAYGDLPRTGADGGGAERTASPTDDTDELPTRDEGWGLR